MFRNAHSYTHTCILTYCACTVGADTRSTGSAMVGSGTVGSGMMGTGMANLSSDMADSGTFGSDSDYISVMTPLGTFSTRQPRQCFNVTIIDDSEVETTEDFFATLTLIPASVTTIDPNRITVDQPEAIVNITDNDVRKL